MACMACNEPTPGRAVAAPLPTRSEPPAPPPMTPEELAEARRKAGFRDDDLAAEKAHAREQGGRQYVREHLAAYRGLVRALRRCVDDIDRSARRWPVPATRSGPIVAGARPVTRMFADLTRRYRELRREGVDAGSTQALIERIYRRMGGRTQRPRRRRGRPGALHGRDDRAARRPRRRRARPRPDRARRRPRGQIEVHHPHFPPERESPAPKFQRPVRILRPRRGLMRPELANGQKLRYLPWPASSVAS